MWPHQLFIGGADRDRTGDLQSAILALSQLSYCPTIMLEVIGWRLKAQKLLTNTKFEIPKQVRNDILFLVMSRASPDSASPLPIPSAHWSTGFHPSHLAELFLTFRRFQEEGCIFR